jgi:hypothetical protein
VGGVQGRAKLNKLETSCLQPARTRLQAIAGGGEAWRGPLKEEKAKNRIGVEGLQEAATEEWEKILLHMVKVGDPSIMAGQTAASAADLDRRVNETLSRIQLVTVQADGVKSISRRGFQFLLLPLREQLWYYILGSLSKDPTMDDAKMVESLVLIFKVGLSLFGRDYPKDDLTPNQHSFLKHLNAVGVTYQRKTGGARYYPTSSAVLLMQPERGGVGASRTGHLITETNFRVYAHEPTVVQEALLSKFIELVRCDFAHVCPI